MKDSVTIDGDEINLAEMTQQRRDVLVLRLLVLQAYARKEIKALIGFDTLRQVNDAVRRAMVAQGYTSETPEDLQDKESAVLRARLLLQYLYGRSLTSGVIDDITRVEKFLSGILGYANMPHEKSYMGEDGQVITQIILEPLDELPDA